LAATFRIEVADHARLPSLRRSGSGAIPVPVRPTTATHRVVRSELGHHDIEDAGLDHLVQSDVSMESVFGVCEFNRLRARSVSAYALEAFQLHDRPGHGSDSLVRYLRNFVALRECRCWRYRR